MLVDVLISFWQFVDYGIEGSVLLLETCIDYLSGAELKNTQLEAVFASLFKCIFDRPNFCTIFCHSLRSTAVSERFLENLSNSLHLSASEKICIGLALLDSEHLEFRTCGKFQIFNESIFTISTCFLLLYIPPVTTSYIFAAYCAFPVQVKTFAWLRLRNSVAVLFLWNLLSKFRISLCTSIRLRAFTRF